jgi:hypothetical protein
MRSVDQDTSGPDMPTSAKSFAQEGRLSRSFNSYHLPERHLTTYPPWGVGPIPRVAWLVAKTRREPDQVLGRRERAKSPPATPR